jgi:hypothetical protein
MEPGVVQGLLCCDALHGVIFQHALHSAHTARQQQGQQQQGKGQPLSHCNVLVMRSWQDCFADEIDGCGNPLTS